MWPSPPRRSRATDQASKGSCRSARWPWDCLPRISSRSRSAPYRFPGLAGRAGRSSSRRVWSSSGPERPSPGRSLPIAAGTRSTGASCSPCSSGWGSRSPAWAGTRPPVSPRRRSRSSWESSSPGRSSRSRFPLSTRPASGLRGSASRSTTGTRSRSSRTSRCRWRSGSARRAGGRSRSGSSAASSRTPPCSSC